MGSLTAASRAGAARAPGSAPPRAAAASARRRLAARAAQAASVVAFVAAWQALAASHADLGLVTFRNVPTPLMALEAARDLAGSGKLARHLGYSLWRVAAGFLSAAAVGIALGLAIGRSNAVRRALLPPLELLRPIPAVAWIPLAILMFPSAEFSMVFITFVGALFPVLLNTVHGVEGVDRRLVAAARSLGAGRWRLFTQVIVPAAAPSIATGLAIGMGTCWFCLVSAEMISGQFGIGYYTWESYTLQDYGGIVVGMAAIGLLGMGSSALIRRAARAAMPWVSKEAR
ncbi:MAG: ABC transporter permease [Burkholderiaceae bacterium]